MAVRTEPRSPTPHDSSPLSSSLSPSLLQPASLKQCVRIYLVTSLKARACSSPMAETMVTRSSLPSSKAAWIWSPRSPSGTLTSSLPLPSAVMRLRKPSSASDERA